MSVIFKTPELACYLPNPFEEDNEGCEAAIQVHTSIFGTIRTYRRTGGYRRIVMSFNLSHPKAAELKSFIRNYCGVWWEMIDYRNRRWKAVLTTNPVEFNEHKRHRTSVTLEFLGVQL